MDFISSRQVDQRLHVLHVFGSPRLMDFGGTPIKLLYQVQGTPHIRFTICTLGDEGELAPRFRDAGAEVVAIDGTHRFDLTAIWRIARLIRGRRVDVVNTHFARASIYGRLGAMLANRPVVVSDHAILNSQTLAVLVADNLLNIFTGARVANSEATRDAVRRRLLFNPDNVRVIYNGLPDLRQSPNPSVCRAVRRRLGLTGEDWVVLNVGSHIPMRDHACILRAVCEVRREIPQLRLVLVGDGPVHEWLRSEVEALELQEVVRFTGNVPREEVEELLGVANVFVNAAGLEAFGMATVEAMLHALPILCARGGSLPEIVTEGVDGLFFSPGSDRELASSMMRLYREPSLATTMGLRARQSALLRFSLASFADCFDKLYSSVARRTNAGR